MRLCLTGLFAIVCIACSAQQPLSTGQAKTTGQCSPSITGSNNTVIYTYCGDQEEGKRIIRLLNAVASDQNVFSAKLDEILAILSKPIKINVLATKQEPPSPDNHPRASIMFYTDDPVDRGQFEVKCSRPCIPRGVCTLEGDNAAKFATVIHEPNLAEFMFRRQFPAMTGCELTVESLDDGPIQIDEIKASDRGSQSLSLTKDQPQARGYFNGSTIQ